MDVTKYIALLLFIALFSCNNNPRIEAPLIPKDLFVLEEVKKMPDSLQSKFPKWVEPGVNCYGVLIFTDKQDVYLPLGYPIPCKIISLHLNGVKCKVTQNIYPYESFGCQVIGIRKGSIWIETDGELFLTKEEAVAALANNPSTPSFPIDR